MRAAWLSSRSARYGLALIGSLAALGGAFLVLHDSQAPAVFRARIAVPGFQSSGLVLLAAELGYFRDEGVDASLDFQATGRDCLDLVLKGTADYAVVFETPVVHAALEGNHLSIITEVHRADGNTAVVARKDRGIESVDALVGRRVGAVPRTNAEFMLDLLLRSRLIDSATVRTERLPIQEVVDRTIKGDFDAAALWEPYLSQVIASAPEKFVRLQSSYYSEFSVLAGLRTTLDEQRPTSYALLRALSRASTDFQTKPTESRAIVDRMLSERGFFFAEGTWDRIDVHIGLSATLLTMLNEEGTWYESRNGKAGRVDMRPLLTGRFVRMVAPQLATYE